MILAQIHPGADPRPALRQAKVPRIVTHHSSGAQPLPQPYPRTPAARQSPHPIPERPPLPSRVMPSPCSQPPPVHTIAPQRPHRHTLPTIPPPQSAFRERFALSRQSRHKGDLNSAFYLQRRLTPRLTFPNRRHCCRPRLLAPCIHCRPLLHRPTGEAFTSHLSVNGSPNGGRDISRRAGERKCLRDVVQII